MMTILVVVIVKVGSGNDGSVCNQSCCRRRDCDEKDAVLLRETWDR